MSVTIGFFSVILPTASSTGLASATFSTSGFGLSFSPVLMPAVILASWSAEMMSTGSDSSGGASNELRRKRHQSPPDHEDVEGDRRNKCLVDLHLPLYPLIHFVTSASRLKPAADSCPITFITVP